MGTIERTLSTGAVSPVVTAQRDDEVTTSVDDARSVAVPPAPSQGEALHRRALTGSRRLKAIASRSPIHHINHHTW